MITKDDLKNILILVLSILIACMCYLCTPVKAEAIDSDLNIYTRDGDWIYTTDGRRYYDAGGCYYDEEWNQYRRYGNFIEEPDGDIDYDSGDVIYENDRDIYIYDEE